jgi:hypothetical protein
VHPTLARSCFTGSPHEIERCTGGFHGVSRIRLHASGLEILMSFDTLAVPACAAPVAERVFDLPLTTALDEREEIQRLRRRSPPPLPLPAKILPAQWHALVANRAGNRIPGGALPCD